MIITDTLKEADCQSCTVKTKKKDRNKFKITRLIIGAVIFAAGFIINLILDLHPWIQFSVFAASYLILGIDVLIRALKNIFKGRIFDENFLMSLATIGAFAIKVFPEAAAVMLFYQTGEFFQDMAVGKSKKSIVKLMDIRPDFANVLKNGNEIKINPATVKVGELVIVKPGEKIPLDGIVAEGESFIDTTMLTGESVPRKAHAGDTVLSGCINQTGVLTIKVTRAFYESTASKIIELVENARDKKARTENFITTFSRYYTPVVTGLAALIAVIPPLFTGALWADWIHRGLVFLVISCPCALVISIPLGFFGGIGGASRKGILVKGGNFMEALCKLKIIAFDKTGTLTKGIFKVTNIMPSAGFSEDDLLELAANAEAYSNHPIAISIINEYKGTVDKSILSQYSELAGYGVSVIRNGKTIISGNYKLMEKNGISCDEIPDDFTTVYIAIDNVFAGHIVISDEIKEDSRSAIAALNEKGIKKIVMLTGDKAQSAQAVADQLNINEVYSELLPQEKVEKIEELEKQKAPKEILAFAGDGINDAPVLARADLGIAMGALGSDAAIEAADIVLMTDKPGLLTDSIDIARFTKKVVWQNIIFALTAKGLFLGLGAFGIAGMWEAVFADVGVALLAVFNAMRIGRQAGRIVLKHKIR